MVPRIKLPLTAILGLVAFSFASTTFAGTVECSTLDQIDGANLLTKYNGALNVVQDNATAFGDRAPNLPQPTTGSELDQLFIRNDANNLYIGITGNLPPNDTFQNTVLIFIETDNSNFNTIIDSANMTGSSALINMHGVGLDFGPNYAIALWNDSGVQKCLLHNMTNPNDVGVMLTQGTHFAVNNTNLAGVNNEPASDPLQQQINAVTATTGFEFSIPLSMLGYATPINASDDIRVHSVIANIAGLISNQSLPPFNATSGNAGGGVACVGIHNPGGNPPNSVDFLNQFPSNQFVTYTLAPGNTAPGGTRDGAAIPSDFGTAVATQNNFTCFGNAAAFTPTLTAGSEIDQMFVASDGAKLYIGVTGNLPINDSFNNTLVIFVDLGDNFGINPLGPGEFYTGGSGAIAGIGNLELHNNFLPSYAILYWREGGQHRATVQDLNFGFSNVVAMEFTTNASRHLDPNVNAYGVNLTNELGVNNIAGDDPVAQSALAATALHGVQFSINLNGAPGTGQTPGFGLGYNIGANPGIKLAAAVISGSGFMSNQWLPPLRKTTGVVRNSTDTQNTPTALADATPETPGTVSSDLTATNALAQGLERVTGIEVTVNITHPAMNELTIDLFNPASNRTVRLWDGDQSGANMSTTFQHGAASLTTWVAPGAGFFDVHDPVANSLQTFNDVDPTAGDWTLFVTDNVNGNTGTLNSWSISLREDVGGGVDCVGFRDDSDPPVSIAADFPTAELISVDPLQLLGSGAPNFSAPRTPGSNIPSAYPTAAVATQNNYTCFGDSIDPGITFTNGSEMDQMWITNTTDRLKLAVAGNLELNSNAFVVLFDTISGGETTLAGNPTPPRPIGGNANNQMGEPGLNGAVLDSCMVADYALSVQTFGDGSYVAELTNLQANTSKLLGFQNMNSGDGVLRAPGNNAGSELDELFIKNDASNLYLGLTGNLEGNGNAIIILLQTAGTGPNTINTTGSAGWPAPMVGLNGDTMPTGFNPDWALVAQRTGNAFQPIKLLNLNNTAAAPIDIAYVTNGVIAPNTYAANNGNTLGVNGNAADMTQSTLAPSATTGYQIAVSRASLGLPAPGSNGSNIRMVAFVTGSSGFWSNQVLPGAVGSNVGNLSTAGDPLNLNGLITTQTYQIASSGGYVTPGSYNGTAIPTFMGPALATQTNHTGFGNQGIDPRYNNDNCVQVAFNNDNSGGVTACSQFGNPCSCLGGNAIAASSVDSGMEVDIALEDLGLGPVMGGGGPTVKVLALVTGATGFASNQFLPGLGGEVCNLQFGPNINLPAIPGDQCLSYTLVAAALGGADPADIDGDGQVNMTDVSVFVQVLLGNNTDPCPLLKSDINPAAPAGINGNDIQAFVNAFLN